MFATLLANLPGMAYRCRDDERYTAEFVSEGCIALTGYAAEAFTSGNVGLGDLIEEADRPGVDREVRAARREGRPFRVRYRLRRADGAVRWVWEQGRYVLDGTGDGEHIEGFIADITQMIQVRESLAESEARYRRLVEASPIAIVLSQRGRVLFANEAAARVWGCPASALIGRDVTERLHPDDLPQALEAVRRTEGEGRDVPVQEYRLVLDDGSVREVEVIAVAARHEGRPATQIMVWDVSAARSEERLRADQAAVLERIAAGRRLEETFATIAAMVEARLPGTRCAIRLGADPPTGDSDDAGEAVVREVIRNHGGDVVAHLVLERAEARAGDAERVKAEQATLAHFAHLVAIAVEHHTMHRRLAHEATHDHLTGLPNRAQLLAYLREALGGHHRTQVAVLFCDIDDFKRVNDSFGHAAGDSVLRRVAGLVQASIRHEDLLARFSGDELVVVCSGLDAPDQVVAVAERIRRTLEEPIWVVGVELRVSVSIGIAVGQPGDPPELVLANADAAMYRAKEQGPGRIELFDARLRERAIERIQIEAGLRGAVDRDEIEVHYQPLVALAGGEVVGAEALLRWRHPELGPLEPARVIGVAEHTGLIRPLGARVLERVCRDLRAWEAAGLVPSGFSVCVNLSPRELAEPDLVSTVGEALVRTGVEPARLSFEITEDAVMGEPELAAVRLDAMKQLGVLLAVDDFGTGYSSLAYLKRFPIDWLKIDRGFIDGVGTDTNDTAIVQAILEMTRTLGLTAVAEGVETPLQAKVLRQMGCTLAQGWLWSPAVEAGELTEVLRAGRLSARRG